MSPSADPQPAVVDLVEVLGVVGFGEFERAADVHRPRLEKWARALRGLADDDLRGEAAAAIHASALVNSWRGNWEHEHCKASACHYESKRRWVAAGHDVDCAGSDLYSQAFSQVWRGQGHNPSTYPVKPCSCGVELVSGA